MATDGPVDPPSVGGRNTNRCAHQTFFKQLLLIYVTSSVVSISLGFALHGEKVSVVEASPERVEPECSLFGRCGGCQYQHVSWGGRAAGLLFGRQTSSGRARSQPPISLKLPRQLIKRQRDSSATSTDATPPCGVLLLLYVRCSFGTTQAYPTLYVHNSLSSVCLGKLVLSAPTAAAAAAVVRPHTI